MHDDLSLLSEFINESQEHLDSLERGFLCLEKGEGNLTRSGCIGCASENFCRSKDYPLYTKERAKEEGHRG